MRGVDGVSGIDTSAVPSGSGWVECLETGGWWLYLRRCAPARHASGHYHETGHPVIQSFEPDETWFFDYRKARYVEGRKLAPPHAHPAEQPVPGPRGHVPRDWRTKLHEGAG